MDPEPTDPGLLLLALNLSDSEPDEAAAPNTSSATATGGPTTEFQPTRADRTALSEAAFQALKQSYVPKVENGNIYQTTPLPSPSNATPPLSKPAAQALLHAAEELYFFRQYAQAASFLRGVLGTEGVEGQVDGETRRLLGLYLAKCEAKLRVQE